MSNKQYLLNKILKTVHKIHICKSLFNTELYTGPVCLWKIKNQKIGLKTCPFFCIWCRANVVLTYQLRHSFVIIGCINNALCQLPVRVEKRNVFRDKSNTLAHVLCTVKQLPCYIYSHATKNIYHENNIPVPRADNSDHLHNNTTRVKKHDLTTMQTSILIKGPNYKFGQTFFKFCTFIYRITIKRRTYSCSVYNR